MGTYYIPRNLRGESRVLYIFSMKALITTGIGALIGGLFYLIFMMIGLANVGLVIAGIFAFIGFAMGTFKIPTINGLAFTKKVGGESLDEILIRYIRFKTGRKIYTYTKEDK